MTLDEYFGDWMKVIDRAELNNVMTKVGQEYRRKPLCPAQPDVFRAFELCPLKDLKVVMLGQDPYPQKGVATGILFGNKANVKNISPSLNIIKEAAINFEVPHNYINFLYIIFYKLFKFLLIIFLPFEHLKLMPSSNLLSFLHHLQ